MINFLLSRFHFVSTEMSRLEKSPLLANGYNPPPTHLNHMQFMQMNHHPGAMMGAGMPPHGMPRPDGAMMKGQPGIPGMDAIARYVLYYAKFIP